MSIESIVRGVLNDPVEEVKLVQSVADLPASGYFVNPKIDTSCLVVALSVLSSEINNVPQGSILHAGVYGGTARLESNYNPSLLELYYNPVPVLGYVKARSSGIVNWRVFRTMSNPAYLTVTTLAEKRLYLNVYSPDQLPKHVPEPDNLKFFFFSMLTMTTIFSLVIIAGMRAFFPYFSKQK